jgi:hypothetical protein
MVTFSLTIQRYYPDHRSRKLAVRARMACLTGFNATL